MGQGGLCSVTVDAVRTQPVDVSGDDCLVRAASPAHRYGKLGLGDGFGVIGVGGVVTR
jgi:hypothetical protein